MRVSEFDFELPENLIALHPFFVPIGQAHARDFETKIGVRGAQQVAERQAFGLDLILGTENMREVP